MKWLQIFVNCLEVFAVVWAWRAYGWPAAVLLFVLLWWFNLKNKERK